MAVEDKGRFQPARYHAKGPGEWLIRDEQTNKVMWINGKLQAYLFADILSSIDLDKMDEGNKQLLFLSFGKQEKEKEEET